MAANFISKENKAFLWDFLYKNGIFKNLTSSHETHIKTLFENEIRSTGKAASGENVTELNKSFISKIVQEIEILKTETSNEKQLPVIKTSMNYTHQEASAERQKIFQNNLQNTQNNFNEFMREKKPNKIDFSDKDGDEVDPNLDSKLAEIVERRKRDMNMVLSSYDTAPTKTKPDNISIGKETKLDSGNIVEVEPKKMRKSVSFDDNIADALGKNIEEMFKPERLDNIPSEVEAFEPDSLVSDSLAPDSLVSDSLVSDSLAPDSLVPEDDSAYEKAPQENNTVEAFLSRLKTKPITDSVENSEESQNKDKVTLQTILHEIAGLRATLDNILEIIKK